MQDINTDTHPLSSYISTNSLIVNVYRLKDNEVQKFLEDLKRIIENMSEREIIIAGDFNLGYHSKHPIVEEL